MSNKGKLTVFYDAQCKVCAWEMESYKKKDKKDALLLIDISSPEFQASEYRLDPEQVKFVLHAQTNDGRMLTGVDTFIEIWRALDRPVFRLLAQAAQRPVIRSLLEVGYQGFIRIRPYLPRKKCDTNQCYRRPAA